MQNATALKAARERRERLFRRTNPHIRPVDLARDAWVLWAAYDLGSFPALKPDPQKPGAFADQKAFYEYFAAFAAGKASVLVVEEDHKYFRERRGPVALISLDNYGGWRVEPQFDFFHWATKRQRLAAVVSFLQMVRYSREVGVCVLRAPEHEKGLLEHVVRRYELLRPCGVIPNAGPNGAEHLYCVKCRRANDQEERELRRAA
jgi:hypothetical protein